MPINPVTGLEEDNEIETQTAVDPNIKEAPKSNDFGFSDDEIARLKKIRDKAGGNEQFVQKIKEGGFEDQFRERLKAGKKEPVDTTELDTSVKPVDTLIEAPDVTPVRKGTGIGIVDAEIDKLREEKETKRKETIDQYNIERGVFEEKKADYKNFDQVNSKIEGVLEDVRNAQAETGTDLTEEQIQQIAIKNGVSAEEVRNPRSIFGSLELSEEGKKGTGVASAERNIEKLTTDFERRKEDLAFQLEGQKEQLNNSIADTRRQLAENVAWATAAGAWSGGMRSSGYERGINNIKDDGERVISRLQKAKDRLNRANEENVKRLTADYEIAQKEAKDTLDRQVEGIKFDTGLKLNGLEGKYGIGSEDLSKALETISEEFGTASLQVFDNYLSSVKKINDITNDNIEKQEKLNDLIEKKMNKKYDDLLENDGILISNTSLSEVTDGMNRGEYTQEHYDKIKKIMTASVTQTLAKRGNVDEGNIETIASLLDKGLTPTQVVAKLGELEKFKKVIDKDSDFTKLNEGQIFNKKTGEVIDTETGESTFRKDVGEMDFTKNSNLINKYPGEASFKNNNPAGITYGISANSEKLLEDEGINFTSGTARPSAEGGNYIRFETVSDGINAQKTLLSKAGTDDIYSRLKQWVGTSEGDNYATQLMKEAGLTKGDKFSEISDGQLDTLVSVQMRKESPNFYKELVNQSSPRQKKAPRSFDENIELFNYADTLTISGRTKFLQERELEDEYISYRKNQGSESMDISDIEDISEINFPEKTTEFKTKSFGYGNRMDTADDMIRNMEDKYKDSWSITEGLSPRGDWVFNMFKTKDRQKFEQARRNFVNAVLRQESGAVIADSEFDNAAKQYFPSAGDSEESIDQKRANREQVIQNMYRSSGKDDKGRSIVDVYKKLKNPQPVDTEGVIKGVEAASSQMSFAKQYLEEKRKEKELNEFNSLY